MILSAAGSPLADTLHRDDEEMAPFIARYDPARVLREVAFKRAILAEIKAVRNLTELTGGKPDPYRDWILGLLTAVWEAPAPIAGPGVAE
jgi:hypothetical protein